MNIDTFISNITGFMEDIQIETFYDAINKDDRLLVFGILIIIFALLLTPIIIDF